MFCTREGRAWERGYTCSMHIVLYSIMYVLNTKAPTFTRFRAPPLLNSHINVASGFKGHNN